MFHTENETNNTTAILNGLPITELDKENRIQPQQNVKI